LVQKKKVVEILECAICHRPAKGKMHCDRDGWPICFNCRMEGNFVLANLNNITFSLLEGERNDRD